MVEIKVENIRATLAKLFDPILVSLLSGKETQVKPDVFVKLVGNLDFNIKQVSNGMQISFKISPQVRVVKFFSFYGDLTGVLVMRDKVILQMAGLPDVVLEAVS